VQPELAVQPVRLSEERAQAAWAPRLELAEPLALPEPARRALCRVRALPPV
jgi:hypothetical protein